MRKLLFITLATLFALPLAGQETLLIELANSIKADELKAHVYTLAADSMEGRKTGEPGQVRAANYIASVLQKGRLDPGGDNGGYFQEYRLDRCHWKHLNLVAGQDTLKYNQDFIVLGRPESGNAKYESIFGGYALSDSLYDDLEGLAVKDKVVFAFSGEPKNDDGNYIISGTDEQARKSYYYYKSYNLQKDDAAGMVLISKKDKTFEEYLEQVNKRNRTTSIRYPDEEGDGPYFTFYTSFSNAVKIMGVKKGVLKKQLKSFNSTSRPEVEKIEFSIAVDGNEKCEDLFATNVVGYVKGSNNSKESIVFIAHYDHLGIRNGEVFNGADDNASGTAAVLELAEAFRLAAENGHIPKKNVVFVLVSGEEIGLYGSKFYTENPLFELESIEAVFNLDMIGRAGPRYGENPQFIGGWTYNSQELYDLSEKYTVLMAPELEYKIKYSERTGGGSDHYYFVKEGIPGIFYFTGIHDDYHEATDMPDKLMYDRMETIVRSVFATAWDVANREAPLIRSEDD